ncbi:MAG: hypothetical protein ACE5GH_03800 [Fidelibacterota bacterium]
MTYTLVILLGSLSILGVILLLTWRLRIQGCLYLDPREMVYSGGITVGFRRNGVGIAYAEGARHFILGSVENPLVKLRISKREKRRGAKPAGIRGIRRQWKNVRAVPLKEAMAKIRRSLRWESFGLTGEIGLDDPSVTGQVFGALMAVANLVPRWGGKVQLTPHFAQNKVDLTCHSTFRFRPAVLLWQAGSLILRLRRR